MSEKPRRRWVYWLGGILAVVLVVCGGATYLLWGLVSGIAGLFVTPPNPTNEPDVVHTFPGPIPADLAFSPDGRLLAAVTPAAAVQRVGADPGSPPPPTELAVYDLTTGTKAFSASYTRWPKAVVFSPDGKHLTVGLGGYSHPGIDGPPAELVVYAVPGFAETYRERPGPDCHPGHLEFTPDGSLLFAFRTDDLGGAQSVTAWRFPTLAAGPTLEVAMQRPECATVTPDGTILVGGRTKDYTAAGERFDRDGNPLGPLKYVASPNGVVVRLAVSGKLVTAVSSTGSQDFDPATGEPVGNSRVHNQQLYVATHASANGQRVGSVIHVSEGALGPDFRPWYTKGGFLHVINLTSGKDHNWRTGCWLPPTPVVFSPDGKHVAAGFDDTAGGAPTGVKVWVSP
jgi:WD40 repeat protein